MLVGVFGIVPFYYAIGEPFMDLMDNRLINVSFSQIGLIFLPFLLYLLVTRQNIKQAVSWRGLSPKNFGIVLIIALAFIPMSHLIAGVLTLFFPTPEVMENLDAARQVYPLWLTLIFTAVMPSIFEELWFTGAFYKEYQAGKVSVLKTALIIGMFFGIFHMNVAHAIFAGIGGVLWIFLVHYTRSILAPMIAHFINNASSGIVRQIAPFQEWSANVESWQYLLVFGGITLALMPVLVLCLRRLGKFHAETQEFHEKYENENAESLAISAADGKTKVFTWAFWAALVVFLVFAVLL